MDLLLGSVYMNSSVKMELDIGSFTSSSSPLGGTNITDGVILWNTTKQHSSQPVGIVRDIGLGVVLAFLCMLTFVGNAMVLHAVRTERRLQTVSSNNGKHL